MQLGLIEATSTCGLETTEQPSQTFAQQQIWHLDWQVRQAVACAYTASGCLQTLCTLLPAPNLATAAAGYRLRHATLLFQQGDVAAARRMMQGVTRKSGNYSEAHAALAAVHWSQGDRERAEEEMLRAESQDERWGDMQWIRGSTRWPPRLEAAMERLLNIQDGQAP